MLVSEGPIILREKFDCSPERLWEAITNVEEMKVWYFPQLESFEAKVGFETQFTIEHQGRSFPHTWKIIDAIPNEKIAYNWNYPNYPGNSIVSFELNTIGDQTELTLTASVTEDYPQDVPEFKRESAVGGWNFLIKDSLVRFLNV